MYLYTVGGSELTLKETLDYGGEVSAISYSPNSAYLAVSGSARKLFIYDTSTYKVNILIKQSAVVSPENAMCLGQSPSNF